MLAKVLMVVVIAAYSTAQSHIHYKYAHHHDPSAYKPSHLAPVAYQAPAIIKTAHVAPVAYQNPPITKIAHVAPVAYHAPVAHYANAPVQHEEYAHAHPQYSFKYGVEDAKTGDIHSQEESRDGDAVHGSYSLVQPDGVKRIVHYSADKNGFVANVQYNGHAAHPEQVHKAVVPVKVVAPVYHQAPTYQSYHQ